MFLAPRLKFGDLSKYPCMQIRGGAHKSCMGVNHGVVGRVCTYLGGLIPHDDEIVKSKEDLMGQYAEEKNCV